MSDENKEDGDKFTLAPCDGPLEQPNDGQPQQPDSVLEPTSLPSGSHMSHYKMRNRTNSKHVSYSPYSIAEAGSKENKLQIAASCCNFAQLGRALADGVNPNAADKNERTALHLAAGRGNVQIIQQLLECGANANAVDSRGQTPLHLAVNSACTNDTCEVLRILLQAGASPHKCDNEGQTALDLAKAKLTLIGLVRDNPVAQFAKSIQQTCEMITILMQHGQNQETALEKLSKIKERIDNLEQSDGEELEPTEVVSEILEGLNRLNLND